ncbi:MAG: prepilin-type N-terminal cleavage/methylation domain-containing protein [Desulfobacterales bacterium]|nr:prepilin-type N-terminal cleavage/methylation domain-containing protein [Desulfobacterales bacterium]
MAGIKNSGFSFVELMVVLFILSTLAFITVPYFAAPGTGDHSEEAGPETLAALMADLKQTAVKEGRDYLLHLDSIGDRVWVVPAAPGGLAETERELEAEEGRGPALKGLSLESVEVTNRPESNPSDTVIRFFSRGYSEAALIRLQEEGSPVTLKLHPFLPTPEVIRGYSHDCI